MKASDPWDSADLPRVTVCGPDPGTGLWAAHNGSRKQWKNSESRHRGKFFKHLSDLVVLTCSQLPSEWWRSLGSESALNDSESLMERRKWPHKLGHVLFRAWWIPLKRSENPAHWSHESCCQWKAWQRGIHQCLHLGKPEDPTPQLRRGLSSELEPRNAHRAETWKLGRPTKWLHWLHHPLKDSKELWF